MHNSVKEHQKAAEVDAELAKRHDYSYTLKNHKSIASQNVATRNVAEDRISALEKEEMDLINRM